jgi:hypothetical protein
MYFPRNWEFGSALSKLRNNFGGGGEFETPKPPLWVRQCSRLVTGQFTVQVNFDQLLLLHAAGNSLRVLSKTAVGTLVIKKKLIFNTTLCPPYTSPLTLSLLMSYIYGAPCKVRNFNVVYIWTYVRQG